MTDLDLERFKHRFKEPLLPLVKAHYYKGLLMDKTDYDALLRSRSLGELVGKLRATRYSRYLPEDVREVRDARRLEKLVYTGLIEAHYQLMRYYPLDNALRSYYQRYISWDVKVVLKGKATGLTYDELIDHLYMRAEELIGRRDLIVRAASAKTLEESVEELSGTEYYNEAKRALDLYSETRDAAVFDMLIDKATTEFIINSLFPKRPSLVTPVMREYDDTTRLILLSLIDEYNLNVALRFKELGLPLARAEELLVEPGFLLDTKELKDSLRREGYDGVVNYLATTRYSKFALGRGRVEALKAPLLYRLDLAKNSWYKSPMTHSILISLIILMENEARNLSAIAFGIENRLPREDVEKSLVIV